MDLRLSRDQKIYLIEANANPDLEFDAEFASSAKEAGLDYPTLLRRIVSLGLNYGQGWQ
jgi:D-alanine-D-alanine ligase